MKNPFLLGRRISGLLGLAALIQIGCIVGMACRMHDLAIEPIVAKTTAQQQSTVAATLHEGREDTTNVVARMNDGVSVEQFALLQCSARVKAVFENHAEIAHHRVAYGRLLDQRFRNGMVMAGLDLEDRQRVLDVMLRYQISLEELHRVSSVLDPDIRERVIASLVRNRDSGITEVLGIKSERYLAYINDPAGCAAANALAELCEFSTDRISPSQFAAIVTLSSSAQGTAELEAKVRDIGIFTELQMKRLAGLAEYENAVKEMDRIRTSTETPPPPP